MAGSSITIPISLACLILSACAAKEAPVLAATSPPVARSASRVRPFAKHPTFKQFGKAAWYNLVGRRTATGEILDRVTPTAAHRTLPLHTIAKVTRLDNGRSVVVRVNDRGPFIGVGRILDLSPRAADALDMKRAGVVPVVLEVLAAF